MNMNKPVSKVLVLEDSPAQLAAIRRFCDEHNLIGLKARKSRLTSVLRSNIDLGAVLLAEDYGGSPDESAAAATRIDALRPELPIILRRTEREGRDGLPPALADVVCATYRADDTAPLVAAIDEYLFSLDYPNALVRGISEITETRLAGMFKHLSVSWETPCIVRDRIIFGELFSLIALESAWCRGYMLMQTEEAPLGAVVRGSALAHDGDVGFRDLNELLGELTNFIWGAFKDRFLGVPEPLARAQVQVPLLVNHKHRYISFGTDNPQLCFKYRLTDETTGASVALDQRFIFSLSWSPEACPESGADVDAMIEAGELELF
jgi:hypothetical protein